MKHVKRKPCRLCGVPTANAAGTCTGCLGAGPARLSWRALMDRGSGGYEMPRVVRLNVEGGRCGGGRRLPAHQGDY